MIHLNKINFNNNHNLNNNHNHNLNNNNNNTNSLNSYNSHNNLNNKIIILDYLININSKLRQDNNFLSNRIKCIYPIIC